MTEDEAIIIQDRALPMPMAWRSKPFSLLTAEELKLAIEDVEEALKNATRWYESEEPIDEDDREYAYKTMIRNRKRLAELKQVMIG